MKYVIGVLADNKIRPIVSNGSPFLRVFHATASADKWLSNHKIYGWESGPVVLAAFKQFSATKDFDDPGRTHDAGKFLKDVAVPILYDGFPYRSLDQGRD